MAQSNHERVGKALELLNEGVRPFIEREMQAVYGETRWQEEAARSLREQHLSEESDDLHLDTQALLLILWDQWHQVFRNVLGHAERSLVSELREVRNAWAHQQAFSSDDAYRALDSMQRLLAAVSASAQAAEVGRQKDELMRLRYEEQRRSETRRVAVAPIEGRPSVGLRPWREIITPQPDVTSGRYQLAEFAADLGQVHRGEGANEYRVPRDFFQRTYLTHGLSRLLTNALQRLSGSGGDPVVDLQTNFGGGKTHSLLALYHLFSGAPIADLVGIEPVLQAAGVARPPQAQRAVLVGYELSPGLPRPKPDGCLVRTLWGELAWQLLGKDGYSLVAEADRQGVSPGSEVLRQLFAAAAPCLVLIDEWVVYARQLYHVATLPGGSFDANLSFAQALTEAAKAAPQTLVVATIPASITETGGEGGQEAATRLKSIFGRVESPWRPADTEEGFEIVRRRLFQNIADPTLFRARDAVAHAFVEMYRAQPAEFPSACREADYERRIRNAYPIHPELFDRLYIDWSSIEKFQRTRGVLRLMAAVVHALWEGQDSSPLILPAHVPLHAPGVQDELMHYLEDNWRPVIEQDIDGPRSLPLRIDSENANLGRYSASRRVARTIYLGSAPTASSPNRGIAESQVKLGVMQPGENLALFGDALRRLSDQSTHLYQDGQRYWYATQPTVTRLAQERAAQRSDDDVLDEIVKRLRAEQNQRGDFARVHVCPASSADIADDELAAHLVILNPQYTHGLRDAQSSAREIATEMLNRRGNAPRSYRNTLVFLAADRPRLEDLKQAVRQYLAWESIKRDMEREMLNLDTFQRSQVTSKHGDAHKTVEARIPETYLWLLVPEQPDPRQPDALQELKLQPQPQGSLSANASRKLKMEEMLVTQYAGTRLRDELIRIPLWRGNHVGVKQLAEDFARYVYLPRLKNSEVLLEAVRGGVADLRWQQDTFSYAESWDEARQRYPGLKAGEHVTVALNSTSVLVRPEVAAAQFAADAAAQEAVRATPAANYVDATVNGVAVGERGGTAILEPAAGVPTSSPMPPISNAAEQGTHPAVEEQQHRRFYGSVKINPRMMAGEAGKIMEEVVKHLTTLYGAEVQVTLEIQATMPNGAPEGTRRTVEENCRTLRFDGFGFEAE